MNTFRLSALAFLPSSCAVSAPRAPKVSRCAAANPRRVRHVGFMLVMAMLLALTGCQASKQSAVGEPTATTDAERKGDAYLKTGVLRGALVEYEKALEEGADPASVYWRMGNAYFNSKMWEESQDAFEQAITHEPGMALAHEGAAFAAFEQGRFQEATRHFESVVRLRPESWVPQAFLAVLYKLEGRTQEALAANGRALQLSGKDAVVADATIKRAFTKAARVKQEGQGESVAERPVESMSRKERAERLADELRVDDTPAQALPEQAAAEVRLGPDASTTPSQASPDMADTTPPLERDDGRLPPVAMVETIPAATDDEATQAEESEPADAPALAASEDAAEMPDAAKEPAPASPAQTPNAELEILPVEDGADSTRSETAPDADASLLVVEDQGVDDEGVDEEGVDDQPEPMRHAVNHDATAPEDSLAVAAQTNRDNADDDVPAAPAAEKAAPAATVERRPLHQEDRPGEEPAVLLAAPEAVTDAAPTAQAPEAPGKAEGQATSEPRTPASPVAAEEAPESPKLAEAASSDDPPADPAPTATTPPAPDTPDTPDTTAATTTATTTAATPSQATSAPTPTSSAAPAERPQAPSARGGVYAVLESSWKNRARADSRVETLAKQGVRAEVVVSDLGEKGIWNRVIIGPRRDRSETVAIMRELKRRFGLKDVILLKLPADEYDKEIR